MKLNVVFSDGDTCIPDVVDKTINFSKSDNFSYTFWRNLNKYPHWYNESALDLLYISLAVFAADRLEPRQNAPDAWSRNFDLYIPVLNLDRWVENKALLEKMLSFLSGDNWTFNFRSRILVQHELEHKARYDKSRMTTKIYSRVCMFSGGLDSYIGAIDLLENDQANTLFVSHYGGGKGTKEYQDYLKTQFISKYGLEERDFQQFFAKVVSGVEDTTRTRSFMFFAHAITLASAHESNMELIIPENGLISLNIPSTFSRLGTSSTRTTHPQYMDMLQSLLHNLGINVLIKNPYQFMTKSEMLMQCSNKDFMQSHIHMTMSCSHPDHGRMQGIREAQHCGYCLPCVIRQAAIKKAGITDSSVYRDRLFMSGDTATEILNSYRLGLTKYNEKYAFMSIQQSGSITRNINAYTDLYKRGMNELKEYIEGIE